MLCSFYLLESKAVLDPNLYIEKSFMKVPVEMETKLNKTIDFNFSDVNLSERLEISTLSFQKNLKER